MKNILITRPKNQAQDLARTLTAQGFSTFIEPLFSVKKLPVSSEKIDEISAVIITSANASFALIDSSLPKETKIFAVGKKTAEQLLENGFKNIIFSPQNSAKSLCELIQKTHEDKTRPILYFHGSIMSLDFARELKKFDFNVKNICVYKTEEMTNFSAEFLQFAQRNSCDEVLIFSKNSAQIFFKLAKKHNLLEYFNSSQILCLSSEILNLVKEFGFKKVKTFSENLTLKNFYD